ncbi:MATE family efflux transporter [Bifidobacterium psychraerophilum]|uniref:MATE family efflux transporter n=1 Tax=Bifidobacterium psychraerophilum TaxID=218140 RepID=UPI0039E79F74
MSKNPTSPPRDRTELQDRSGRQPTQWHLFLSSVLPLAGPIAFQQFMLALSSSADSLMLARIGQEELAAASLAAQYQFFFSLFLAALTLGMSILVAQYWGAGNTHAIESILACVMRYAVLLSLIFCAVLVTIPRTLMQVMTNDPTLITLGAQYLRVSAVSYVFLGISQIYLCLMKNTGFVVMSTAVSSVGVLIHIIVNAMLIYGHFGFPALGILGAALSSIVSRAFECIWPLLHSLRRGRIRVQPTLMLRTQRVLERDYWRYCLPVLGNEIVWGGGFMMYTVIMGHLNTDAIAANSIANIVKDLLVCFCLGLGNGGGIYIGNLLGQNRLSNAKETARRLCHLAIAVGALTGGIILLLRPFILHATNLSPRANEYLSGMLIICSYYVIGKSINSTTVAGIFPAGGDARFGLLCDSVTMWIIVIPLGIMAAFTWKLPVLWVYALLNVDEIIKLPAVFAHYRRYRWLRNVTRATTDSSIRCPARHRPQ